MKIVGAVPRVFVPALALLALGLSLGAIPAQGSPPSLARWEVSLLFLPCELPLPVLVLALPRDGDAAAGTETFEALHDAAEAAGVYEHLRIPENVFLQGDKERSERIAKDALPKKVEPTRLESILLPIAAVAIEVMDAAY